MDTENIQIEPLGDGRRILINDVHRFGTDAFLLADFAAPKAKENAVDLCTGCGIIPTLWLKKGNVRSVLGIEINEDACALAEQTARSNGDTVRFEVLCMDIRKINGVVDRERYDLVSCNPPYFAPGSGFIAPDPQRAAARTELDCSLSDVCAAAKYLLRYGARLVLCHRPERLADIFCTMREYDIEPKKLRMVQRTASSAPWLVLVEGRRGGKPALDILPPFIMYNDDKTESEELKNMYGTYRDGRGK